MKVCDWQELWYSEDVTEGIGVFKITWTPLSGFLLSDCNPSCLIGESGVSFEQQ